MRRHFHFSIPVILSVLLLCSIAVFMSCRKNTNENDFLNAPPDLITKVSSSVCGFVTDENDQPVKNASVQFGTATISTDKYGYFEAKNIQVIKDAATVTVTRAGYFKGIKTYIAQAGKSVFFRIKLIPKTIAGTVSGSAGGTVTSPNGLSVTLAAGSIVTASTNASYNGTVNIAYYFINPTATDLAQIMPGDLRGINTDGNIKLLTTYGMAAVELTGSGGELLQIASGKKASLTFPVPAAISSTAPATIPLWYFDEARGLWKEEGKATKTGSKYVGEVSHFSFWNCDLPNNYIQFNCTIVNSSGQPISGAFVKISQVNNPFMAGYGHTDSAGYVSGAIPDNAQLLLEVFSSSGCTIPSYSQNFTTTNTTVSLGTITIPGIGSQAIITGSVTNCSGGTVTNGYIIVLRGNLYERHNLSNTGTYSFNALLCGNTNNITLIGEDITNGQQSNPIIYSLHPGNNIIPNIQACGVNTQQFINYTVNGIAYSFAAPADSVVSFENGGTFTNFTVRGNKIPLNNNTVNFVVTSSNIPTGGAGTLYSFTCNQIVGSTLLDSIPVVNITEYGPIGGYVAGNFTGSCTAWAPPNTVYNFTCSFRVKKYF